MTRKALIIAGAASLSLALCACGGGGGGGVASIPPPPPSPPPPPPPPPPSSLGPEDVRILANPTAQTFASAGVSATGTGSGFTSLSKADADQVHIRYSSGGYYEIQIPGAAWEKLTFAKGTIPADPATANDFQPESAPQGGAYLITEIARTKGYKYSELAAWSDGASRFGQVAFGEATLASEMPQTGSASYHGIVSGTSDLIGFDSFDGNFPTPVGGTVDLNFDFGKGTLGGSMTVSLNDMSGTIVPLGTFSFTDTVFSAGSTTYSGKFDTSVSGQNYFLGQFTGPNAEETIGAWALPFHYENVSHQAFGAWIAKQP